jgi:glycosyltransferase involved in cell wall biosynthesis
MPVSVMEAFACGLPVVSTAPEGMRYLLDDGRTGLLSEPGDAHALAKNVARVLNDPALASRLISEGHKESQRYDWKSVRDQWLQVYGIATAAVKNEQEPLTFAGSPLK